MQEQVDERISARFEKAMMSEIDVLVKDQGFTNRSEFLRIAARTLLDTQQRKNTTPVEIPQLLGECIDTMVVRGFYRSREHAIQTAIEGFFNEERVNQALKTMERMEIVAGKKVEADLEKSTSRQIITP
jgi:Arc/MetJ-type ribon-helix-helix transcriptional regulator